MTLRLTLKEYFDSFNVDKIIITVGNYEIILEHGQFKENIRHGSWFVLPEDYIIELNREHINTLVLFDEKSNMILHVEYTAIAVIKYV